MLFFSFNQIAVLLGRDRLTHLCLRLRLSVLRGALVVTHFLCHCQNLRVLLLDFLIGALTLDCLIVDTNDVITLGQVLDSIGYKYSGLALQFLVDALIKEELANMSIDSSNRIIHNDDVCVRVDGSGEGDSRLLTTREVDTTITNLTHVSTLQNIEIVLHAADMNRALVFLFIIRLAEEDVASNSIIDHPGLLRGIGDGSIGDTKTY